MPKTAIFLTLETSDLLRGWLIAGHFLPLLLIIWHAPWITALLFAGLALLLFWFNWRRFTGRQRIGAVRYDGEQWQLQDMAGQWREVALISSLSFRHYWLFPVFVDGSGKVCRLFIPCDATDADSFRRLKVLLTLQQESARF